MRAQGPKGPKAPVPKPPPTFITASQIRPFTGDIAVGARYQLIRLKKATVVSGADSKARSVQAHFEIPLPGGRSKQLCLTMTYQTAVRKGIIPPASEKTLMRRIFSGGIVSSKEFLLERPSIPQAGRHKPSEEGIEITPSNMSSLSEKDLAELEKLPMTDATRMLLTHKDFKPQTAVQAGGFTFYMSPVIKVESKHLFVLALVPVLDKSAPTLKRRFYWKSRSGGNWRATPFVAKNGHIVKGTGIHYTAETQLAPEIEDHLQALEKKDCHLPLAVSELLPLMSSESDLVSQEERLELLTEFGQKVHCTYLQNSGIRHLQPGSAFSRDKDHFDYDPLLVQRLRSFRYPSGFIPDFTQPPESKFEGSHFRLGSVTFEEYEAPWKQALVWKMAKDKEGRTWCQSVSFRDATITSFGVLSQMLDTGILTSKPLEYITQADALPHDLRLPFDENYADITPALCLLRPINLYRLAQGLPKSFEPRWEFSGNVQRLPGEGKLPSPQHTGKFYIGSQPGDHGYEIASLRAHRHATIYADDDGYYIRKRDRDGITLISKTGKNPQLVRPNDLSPLVEGDIVTLGESKSGFVHLKFTINSEGIGSFEPFTDAASSRVKEEEKPDALLNVSAIPSPHGLLLFNRNFLTIEINGRLQIPGSLTEIKNGDTISVKGNKYRVNLQRQSGSERTLWVITFEYL